MPVAASPDELKHPNLNRAALEQLAVDSHGKLVELYNLGSLARRAKRRYDANPAVAAAGFFVGQLADADGVGVALFAGRGPAPAEGVVMTSPAKTHVADRVASRW